MELGSRLELQAILAGMYPQQNFVLQPYGFPLSLSAALAAGAQQTNQLQITGNADFLLTGVSYRCTVAGGAQTAATKICAQVRMLVTDAGSNNQFTQAAVDLENYCTNGAYGRDLPWPRLVKGRSTLTVQLTNYGDQVYGVLDLYFEGLLIQVTGPAVRQQPAFGY